MLSGRQYTGGMQRVVAGGWVGEGRSGQHGVVEAIHQRYLGKLGCVSRGVCGCHGGRHPLPPTHHMDYSSLGERHSRQHRWKVCMKI